MEAHTQDHRLAAIGTRSAAVASRLQSVDLRSSPDCRRKVPDSEPSMEELRPEAVAGCTGCHRGTVRCMVQMGEVVPRPNRYRDRARTQRDDGGER